MDKKHSTAPDPHPSTDECPKLYPCSGCGSRFPARELVECVEDNHDDLTYFHGDHLCRRCTDNAGVAY